MQLKTHFGLLCHHQSSVDICKLPGIMKQINFDFGGVNKTEMVLSLNFIYWQYWLYLNSISNMILYISSWFHNLFISFILLKCLGIMKQINFDFEGNVSKFKFYILAILIIPQFNLTYNFIYFIMISQFIYFIYFILLKCVEFVDKSQ